MKRPMNFILVLALIATAMPAPNVHAAETKDVVAAGVIGLLAGWFANEAVNSQRSGRVEYDDGYFDNVEVLNEGSVVVDGYVEYDRCMKVLEERCDQNGRLYDSLQVYCDDRGEIVRVRNGIDYFEVHQRRRERQVRRQRRERPQILIQINRGPRYDHFRPSPMPPPPPRVIYPGGQSYQVPAYSPDVLPMDGAWGAR